MILAPIALFVYNRPEHSRKTLQMLSECDLADKSDLYIFADGPKPDCTPECLENIKQVRQIISSVTWPKRVAIVNRDSNIGLAKSIVAGVTELCDNFGRVIVLEDDLLVEKSFLIYMNEALEKYKNEFNVYQISGYQFPVEFKNGNDVFFIPLTTTWGWATWKRAWKIFDWNPSNVIEKMKNKKIRKQFDLNNAYSYSVMLFDRIAGKNDSWGILFWWAVFNVNGLVLFPKYSLVDNIGFDGSGTHFKNRNDMSIRTGTIKGKPYGGFLPAEIRVNNSCYLKVINHLKRKNGKSFKGILSKFVIRLSFFKR